jgi:hypothetical protein
LLGIYSMNKVPIMLNYILCKQRIAYWVLRKDRFAIK